MAKNFPSAPEQLDRHWLTEVLGYQVDDFEVAYFSEGTGVMPWVMRIMLQTAHDKPNSIIAKFPSKSAVNREGARRYDMYGREVDFYKNIKPRVDVKTPVCLFAAIDRQTYEFVLLLEDLDQWSVGDQVAGCSLEEAKLVISALARLHASGWQASSEREVFPGLLSHNNPGQIEGMQATYPIGWPVVLEKFGHYIPQPVRRAAENLPQAIPSLLERMCRQPVCLTHADLRLDNLFFRDGEMALVDWQSVCTSAPEQDLAYFITQSVPVSVRHQHDLVALYHQALTAQGIEYSLDVCRERYVVSALYLLCYAVVIAGTLDLGNSRGLALGEVIVKNTFTALTELDAFARV